MRWHGWLRQANRWPDRTLSLATLRKGRIPRGGCDEAVNLRNATTGDISLRQSRVLVSFLTG